MRLRLYPHLWSKLGRAQGNWSLDKTSRTQQLFVGLNVIELKGKDMNLDSGIVYRRNYKGATSFLACDCKTFVAKVFMLPPNVLVYNQGVGGS